MIVATAIAVLHVWNLGGLPRGLYVDETSIGHNAYQVITTGEDEHGEAWPVFFKAFGEYKNPLYIYTAGIMMRLGGPSATTLRLTSTLFFGLLVTALSLLTYKLTDKNHGATLIILLASGTLPWFFTLSRLAFEVISHMATIAWALYFIYVAFERPSKRWPWWLAPAAAGVTIGLSMYAYSTARLLSAFLVGSVLLLYSRRHYQKIAILIASLAIVLIPYGSFALSHPGALTARFHVVSYVYNNQQSSGEKIKTFAHNYLAHLTPSFLLSQGDANPRHSTGYGGVLYSTVLIVALIGMVTCWQHRRSRIFIGLLLINLIVSPVAAALTDNAVPHGLRSSLLPVYILLFFGMGLAWLFAQQTLVRRTAGILIIVALLGESAAYLNHYFTEYPEISTGAFEGYGIPETLDAAVSRLPRQIIIDSSIHQAYSHLAFYQLTRPQLEIPIVIQASLETPDSCLVYSIYQPVIPSAIAADTYHIAGSSVGLRCWQ